MPYKRELGKLSQVHPMEQGHATIVYNSNMKYNANIRCLDMQEHKSILSLW
jgi:hypothetical protein